MVQLHFHHQASCFPNIRTHVGDRLQLVTLYAGILFILIFFNGPCEGSALPDRPVDGNAYIKPNGPKKYNERVDKTH